MIPIQSLRHAGLALALAGASGLFAAQTQAAAFIDFSSEVTAGIELLEINGATDIPADVQVFYGNEMTSDDFSWSGSLSFASSDPFLSPDLADEEAFDLFDAAIENQHLNQGSAGADKYGVIGNAASATLSEGFVEIVNNSSSPISVLVNAYIDMTVAVNASPLQAFDTASALAYAGVQLYDDALVTQVDVDQVLTANLAGGDGPYAFEQAFTYSIDAGDSLAFSLLVDSNGTGTATATPAPASIALLLTGLTGLTGIARLRKAKDKPSERRKRSVSSAASCD